MQGASYPAYKRTWLKLVAWTTAAPQLEALGLQIRLTNGTAQIFTVCIQNEKLSAFISEKLSASNGAGEFTEAALEVLACIAFKQPISEAEIDQIFGDVDKRPLVAILRQMDLVEEFAGSHRRLRFATPGAFLRRFELDTNQGASTGV